MTTPGIAARLFLPCQERPRNHQRRLPNPDRPTNRDRLPNRHRPPNRDRLPNCHRPPNHDRPTNHDRVPSRDRQRVPMALRAAKCDEDASAISNKIKDLAGVFNGAVAPTRLPVYLKDSQRRPGPQPCSLLFTICENAPILSTCSTNITLRINEAPPLPGNPANKRSAKPVPPCQHQASQRGEPWN